jgi:hypothetical protein
MNDLAASSEESCKTRTDVTPRAAENTSRRDLIALEDYMRCQSGSNSALAFRFLCRDQRRRGVSDPEPTIQKNWKSL